MDAKINSIVRKNCVRFQSVFQDTSWSYPLIVCGALSSSCDFPKLPHPQPLLKGKVTKGSYNPDNVVVLRQRA